MEPTFQAIDAPGMAPDGFGTAHSGARRSRRSVPHAGLGGIGAMEWRDLCLYAPQALRATEVEPTQSEADARMQGITPLRMTPHGIPAAALAVVDNTVEELANLHAAWMAGRGGKDEAAEWRGTNCLCTEKDGNYYCGLHGGLALGMPEERS